MALKSPNDSRSGSPFLISCTKHVILQLVDDIFTVHTIPKYIYVPRPGSTVVQVLNLLVHPRVSELDCPSDLDIHLNIHLKIFRLQLFRVDFKYICCSNSQLKGFNRVQTTRQSYVVHVIMALNDRAVWTLHAVEGFLVPHVLLSGFWKLHLLVSV